MTKKGYFKNGAWIEFPQSDFIIRIDNAIKHIEWESMNSFSDPITYEFASQVMTNEEIKAIDEKSKIIEYDNWFPTKISGTLYTRENLQNHAKLQEQDRYLALEMHRMEIITIILLAFTFLIYWLINSN